SPFSTRRWVRLTMLSGRMTSHWAWRPSTMGARAGTSRSNPWRSRMQMEARSGTEPLLERPRCFPGPGKSIFERIPSGQNEVMEYHRNPDLDPAERDETFEYTLRPQRFP